MGNSWLRFFDVTNRLFVGFCQKVTHYLLLFSLTQGLTIWVKIYLSDSVKFIEKSDLSGSFQKLSALITWSHIEVVLLDSIIWWHNNLTKKYFNMKGQEWASLPYFNEKNFYSKAHFSRSLVSVLVFIQFRVDRKVQRILLLQLRYHKENINHAFILQASIY